MALPHKDRGTQQTAMSPLLLLLFQMNQVVQSTYNNVTPAMRLKSNTDTQESTRVVGCVCVCVCVCVHDQTV